MAGRSVWVCGILLFVGSLSGCFDDDEPAADVSVLLEDEGSPAPDIVEPEPDLSSGPEDVLVVEDEGSPAPDIVEPEPDLSSGPEDVLVVEDEGSPAPDIVEPEPDLSSGPEDVLAVEDEGSPTPDIVEPEPDLSSGPEDVLVVEDEGSSTPDIVEPEPEDVVALVDEGGPAEDIVEPEPDLSSGPEDVLVVLDEGPEPECVSDVDCVTPQGCNEPRICDPTGTCVPGPYLAIASTEWVGLLPLAAGDLIVNGVVVGATTDDADPLSTQMENVSAIAKATVINAVLAETGVVARPLPTRVRTTSTVAAGTCNQGDLRINWWQIGSEGATGPEIFSSVGQFLNGPVIVLAGDADGTLRAAINYLRFITGVRACLDEEGRLSLTASDGRNIALHGLDITCGGLLEWEGTGVSPSADGFVGVGGLELKAIASGGGFTVSGVSPVNAGFASGFYTSDWGAANVCDDDDPCTADSCDPLTGLCTIETLPCCSAELQGQCEGNLSGLYCNEAVAVEEAICSSDDDCNSPLGCVEAMYCAEEGVCKEGPYFSYNRIKSVGFQAIEEGELRVNTGYVGASNPEDDLLSSAWNETSAIAKVKAINQVSDESGVVATVRPTYLATAAPVAAGQCNAGDLVVNGFAIGSTLMTALDVDHVLRGVINSHQAYTGVVACVDGNGRLNLTAVDGRNIVLSGVDMTCGGSLNWDTEGLNPMTTDVVATGGLELKSITTETILAISGADPACIGAISGGFYPGYDHTFTCNDGKACTIDRCDWTTGACSVQPLPCCSYDLLGECEGNPAGPECTEAVPLGADFCASDEDCVTDQGCNEPLFCSSLGACLPGPFYALITVESVTNQPLLMGDLVINGVAIGPSLAADDPYSYSGNELSSRAKATAINQWTESTGVVAELGPNLINYWDAQPVAAGLLLPGDLLINGVEVPATVFLAGDADSSLRDSINFLTPETGVYASLGPSNQLMLVEGYKRNLEIGGLDPSVGGAVGLSPGIYTGGLTLRSSWSQGITIAGANPGACGFFWSGTTAPNWALPEPCVDWDPCTIDSCDVETGVCVYEYLESTPPCGIP